MSATPMLIDEDVALGLVDSTDLLGSPEALRQRAAHDGYLFLRGLLPRQDVLELRRRMLGVLNDFGWIDRTTELMDGIVDLESVGRIDPQAAAACGVGVPLEAYRQVQKLQAFHALAHHPKLLAFYHSLFDAPPLPHPRNIARLMIHAPGFAPTPAHQDYIHIQGTQNVWTCWLPVGDCPVELGGLAVLPASHEEGILPGRPARGAGGQEVQVCGRPRYLTTDYQAGDVLTFHSLAVHKSLPHTQPRQVRLSCDFRYQPRHEDIQDRSLAVHCNVLEWEQVYEQWTGRDDLRYYWRRLPLQHSEWDDTIHWQKERICD